MALKRWRWFWGPCLAAAVVAIALLPPGFPSGVGLSSLLGFNAYWNDAPRRLFRDALSRALAEQRRRLQQSRRVDSLVSLARGPRAVRYGDGSALGVFEAPLTPDSARSWLRAAAGELALYPSRGGTVMRTVVALYSNPARRRDPSEDYNWWGVRELRSSAVAGGECIVEINLLESRAALDRQLVGRDASGRPIGHFMGMCALYARFGAPGPSVTQWIGDSPNRWWSRYNPLAVLAQEARRPVRRHDIAESREYYYYGGSWDDRACVRGSAQACARAAGFACQDEDWRGGCYNSGILTPDKLLAYLLTSGTQSQFAAFWRSPLGVGDALEQAYGRPAGQLAYEAFSHWYYAAPGGPRAEPRLVIAGMLWAGIALALALIAGRRWTTEI